MAIASNLVDWTFSPREIDPDNPVLIDASDPGRFLTRRKALDIVASLAGAFEPNSTVCLHLPNDVLYPVLVLGILASKCRWTGTNVAYTSPELQHHFKVSKTRFVIALAEHQEVVKAAIVGLQVDVEIIMFMDILKEGPSLRMPDNSVGLRTLRDLLHDPDLDALAIKVQSIQVNDVAILQSTSGTTGLPKMASRTHGAIIQENMAAQDNHAEKPYDVRRLFCTPIFHAFTTPELIFTPLRLGIPTYIMRRYDDTFAQKIHSFGITETAAPPPMLKMLHDKPEIHHLLQSIRMIFCGGAPLSPELRNRALEMFEQPPRIVQVWGMTEGGWFSTFKYPEDDASGSVGRIIPGYQIKLSDDAVLELSETSQVAGELLMKGPQLMTGYYGNEQESKDAFDEDGWLRTGDVGYVKGGKVYIVDRAKDLIKVNGWQVAPAEIEAAIQGSPEVEDAAAIAVGHGLDEHPLLFVVPSSEKGVNEEGIRSYISGRLARHKFQRMAISATGSIPRNPSGKIMRKMLKKLAEERGLT